MPPQNNKNEKNSSSGGGRDKQKVPPPAGGTPQAPQFTKNIAIAVLIFMLISAAYILISGNTTSTKSISLSDLAKDVSAGTVKTIEVNGDDLTVTLTDGSTVAAKKEVESSLSETLKNYGVPTDKVDATNITIKEDSGFSFWLFNVILPVVLPILIIVVFFWFLSRQAKGSGMQAFTFGQSKARLTRSFNPTDSKACSIKAASRNQKRR